MRAQTAPVRGRIFRETQKRIKKLPIRSLCILWLRKSNNVFVLTSRDRCRLGVRAGIPGHVFFRFRRRI